MKIDVDALMDMTETEIVGELREEVHQFVTNELMTDHIKHELWAAVDDEMSDDTDINDVEIGEMDAEKNADESRIYLRGAFRLSMDMAPTDRSAEGPGEADSSPEGGFRGTFQVMVDEDGLAMMQAALGDSGTVGVGLFQS